MNKLNTAPAFKLAILFSAGIIAGRYLSESLYTTIPLLIIFVAAAFVFRKNESVKMVLVFSGVIAAGMIKINVDEYVFESKTINLTGRNLSNVFLTGVIDDLPEYSGDRIRFTVDVSEIVSREDTLKTGGRALVILKQKKKLSDIDSMPVLEAGDRVLLFGTLRDAPEETNPGDFNYREYLALNDIHKTFNVNYFSDAEVVSKNNLNFFEQKIVYPARKFAIENINRNTGGEEGAFLNGLVTGYRSDMPKEMKEDFIKAGVMHLVAVSGLNVAYIIIFLTLFFSLLRIPVSIRIYVMIAALIFYVFFTGAPASIVRAAIMGAVLLINFKVQRKINFYNVIGISALMILIYNSTQLFSSGFILSYSSVISIVVIYNKIDKYIGKRIDNINRKYRKAVYYLYGTLLTTLAAQIGVLPITLMYFGKISISGIFTNMLVIPLSNFSLALGFLQVISGTFSEFISSMIAAVNYYILNFQLGFIKWAAGLSFSYAEYYSVTLFAAVIFYAVLLLLLATDKENYKYTAGGILAVIAVFAIVTGFKSSKFEITYLALGNADCTHIRTPDGSNIIIDAGIENQYNRATSGRILPYLKKQGVKKIDLLILTTEIGKNYASLKTLLENFDVGKIVLPLKNEISGKSERIIIENKIQMEEIKSVKEISGYGGVNLKFFSADTSAAMLKAVFANKSFLFTGKAEISDEKDIIKKYGENLKADVLKVAKYGSRKSTSRDFLEAIKPESAVISTSGIEEKNLPADEVLERLREMNVKILRTDETGAVSIIVDN